ncbi:recombinase family protein [uncultured Clostridium sp.]|uniref:recombinase family protein n=3 Tax=uncultured Clostridium sp. TaxID=59620 RepID=UPI00263167E5|nr:recombinase family protein [uncultured Clostridium sp.]
MKKIAIYSRKSKFTGKGDSIENQIEMCKEYITNTIGKDVEFTIYEDEGFSGGNLDRPKFKRLMTAIKNKKFDILVCYRLDRISRNVADFSSTLEVLQSNNCSFISIKEQFDTSSPMGRAMIYIASVFAQLERETIAERVKDNMLELAKNGKWTGGKIPVGFNSEKIEHIDDNGLTRITPQLVINDKEMEFVNFLYSKYIELGSLHKLEVYIHENNIKSRNDVLYEKSSLKTILQNPIYVKANNEVVEYLKNSNWNVYGEPDNIHSLLTYNKTEQTKKDGKYTKSKKDISERFAAVSSIKGYIEPDLWLSVQKQFDKNKDTFPRLGKTHNALLVGKLRCGKCKEYMLVTHGRVSKVTGEKLFYYTCSLKRKSKGKLCDNGNAKAADIEKLVLLSLKQLSLKKKGFLSKIRNKYKSDTSDENISIEKLTLNKSLKEKKSQIDNLVTKLSLCDGIEDILLDRIKTLKSECITIEQNIENLETKALNLKNNLLNLDLIEELLDKCATIEELERTQQKLIIDNLIDTIYWYSDGPGKGNIEIKFVGTDDSQKEVKFTSEEMQQLLLHFCSHSMTYENKNATYRKVFETIENTQSNIYYMLPENGVKDKIYKLRMIKGLTQKEFALKTGIGYSSVCKYEAGYKIDKKNKIKICVAFDIPLTYLE